MGEGYRIILHGGFGVGLNMINPRFFHDADRNNWWVIRDHERPAIGDIDDDWIGEVAIARHKLPWLDDEHPAPDDWKGSPFGAWPLVKCWEVIR